MAPRAPSPGPQPGSLDGSHGRCQTTGMTLSASRIARALLVSILAALPSQAESLASSSASSASSASIGSVSDSISGSSGSAITTVAEGDYRIIDVAAAGRPDTLRLKMQPVADPRADAVIHLDVPRAALGDRGSPRGDVVAVRQRPYGYEFAWADTRAAFFLVLAADWRRELDPRPVPL